MKRPPAAILYDWPGRRRQGPPRTRLHQPAKLTVVPSPYQAFWGAAESTTPAATTTEEGAGSFIDPYKSYISTGLELWGLYSTQTDSRVRLEKAQVELINLKEKKAQTGLGFIYDPLIRKKEAEIRALKEKMKIVEQAETATNVWNTLGWTASALGIGILGIGAYRLATGRKLWG